MLDWLLDYAIEKGLEWLVEKVEQTVDGVVTWVDQLITGDGGLVDATLEYLNKFEWHLEGDKYVNQYGDDAETVAERFKRWYELSHDDNEENDLPVESDGIINTDLEELQAKTLATQIETVAEIKSVGMSCAIILSFVLIRGLFKMFTLCLNYSKAQFSRLLNGGKKDD